MVPHREGTDKQALKAERPWEIWAFGLAFVVVFFLFARSQSGPEPVPAAPQAASEIASIEGLPR